MVLKVDSCWEYRDGRRWKVTLLEIQGLAD